MQIIARFLILKITQIPLHKTDAHFICTDDIDSFQKICTPKINNITEELPSQNTRLIGCI